jgi:peptide/nickel transport system substrate-binding protein
MQQIVKDEGGAVVLMYANYVYASSKQVAHPETIGNNWAMDGARVIERWWMA